MYVYIYIYTPFTAQVLSFDPTVSHCEDLQAGKIGAGCVCIADTGNPQGIARQTYGKNG